jgi:hypothetical protein
MKPEKRRLIDDLLDEGREARRAATLLAGGRILRRRRWRRAAMRGLGVAAILGIAVSSIQRMNSGATRLATNVPAHPAEPERLTDEQLLALFPDTPVGLVTLDNGTKRLVFPRPEDEERFVSRF